ncbi:MAG: DNA polymerase domain-containing protein [bacterium]|nr:DNA polymerase domain-containing protein [bacterium]
MTDNIALDFSSIYSSSPALFGADPAPGLVGCAIDSEGWACTWRRVGADTLMNRERFEAFLWLSDKSWADGFGGDVKIRELEGEQPFRYLAELPSFAEAAAFSRHVASQSGINANAPDSPQIFINDAESQYLMRCGATYYKGMSWSDVKHLWLYPMCEGGPFVSLRDNLETPLRAVCLRFSDGTKRFLLQRDYKNERALLEAVSSEINAYDPDIVAGHQLFDCIMPYLTARAKKHRFKLALGRCADVPSNRAVRQKIAEKNLDYRRYDVLGRELIDTWVLAQLYDVSARQMESYELLDVAEELLDSAYLSEQKAILARRDTAGEADSCLELHREQIGVLIDISAQITEALSQSYFLQAQIFPYTYQNAVTRGNATRINSLFLREYLRAGRSLPARPTAQSFPGGFTSQEFSGLAHEVYHCDVQSLYPSIITHWQIKPAGDSLNIFLGMLSQLRSFRLQAKEQARAAKENGLDEKYRYYHALQTVFKILINSFYGYLGFEQGNFADFTAAAQVTARGREILQSMIAWLKERGCTIIEVDTDGIYFMTPETLHSEAERQALIKDLNDTLPSAINLEFDGHYRAMYCHKMKNYALLDYEGNITLRGSALRARNVEPFLRETLGQMLSLALHDRSAEIPALLRRVADDLGAGRIPLAKLAKTDTLISSLESYSKKIGDGGRNRAAAYELALKSGRDYKAGDKVTYYVTGTKATVSAWQNAKLLSDNTDAYDANIKYYLSKLKDLEKKFSF